MTEILLLFAGFLLGGVTATFLVAPRIAPRVAVRPASAPRVADCPDVLVTRVTVRPGSGDVVGLLRAAALSQACGVYGVNAELRVEATGQLEQLPSGAVTSRVVVRQLHEGGSGGS
jgi:hypothetical protein